MPADGNADVLVNGTSLHDRHAAGVQRYAREMTSRMLSNDGVAVVVPAPVEWLPADRQIVRAPGRVSRRAGPWSWIQRELRAAVGDRPLWSPTNRAPLGVPCHVPTVHDVSVLDHPEWFRRSFVQLHRVYVPRLVRQGRRVITDSEFSRERIVSRFRVPDDHVVVVAPGVSEAFAKPDPATVDVVRARYGLTRPYVLTVGTLEPRKNLTRLLAAWNELPERDRQEWELVVVGERGRVFASTPMTEPGATHLSGVPDSDLPALYAGATVFAYPSLYEGFGLPPLEAMACGTPVLSSDRTATGEILRGAAALVDPTDVGAISRALATLLADAEQRSELSALGLAHARRFSWDTAAARVLDVVREAAG